MPPVAWMCLLGWSLLGTVAWAQPLEAAGTPEARRAEVLADGPLEVRVRAGHLTVVLFDARVDAGAVKRALERHAERFDFSDAGEGSVVLVPSAALGPGERIRVTVPFMDGAAPARVVLELVADALAPDTRVDVYRQPRSAASLQAELDATRRALAAAREMNRALREQLAQGAPVDRAGEAPEHRRQEEERGRTRRRLTHKGGKSGSRAEQLDTAWTYRAAERVVLELHFKLDAGAPDWAPGRAVLTGETGEARVLAVWARRETWEGGGSEGLRVMAEAALPPEDAATPYRLELFTEDGELALRLPRVVLEDP